MRYRILLHEESYGRAAAYFGDLEAGRVEAGAFLRRGLDALGDPLLTTEDFLGCLINSKRPQIFAESAVAGDGRDWNRRELSILGDAGIAVPVTVYDDGKHDNPAVHADPFAATLLYVPGALLRSDRGQTPADWEEVTSSGELSYAAYYALYERRLLPSFLYANELAGALGQQALLTIPGIGCGQFAGRFQGQLGAVFKDVLADFLARFSSRLPHVRAVYYDPYRECANERVEIEQIAFLVRPLTQGNGDKPQLCPPKAYEEVGDDFSRCCLFSFVAWDHVSWPGNDFYAGARTTDDGVKAAATSSMAVMTGVEGRYDRHRNGYDPPPEYRNWEEVVVRNGLQIAVRDHLLVLV